MKLIDRALANHLELGLHPRLLALSAEVVILSLGARVRFSIYALKKALRTKLMGFNISKEEKCIFLNVLGMEFFFWVYKD